MLNDNTKKIIADQWIGLLYARLEQLNEAYIRMHEGCIDLVEILPIINQPETLDKIQYQNAGFIITYIRNILLNGKALLETDKWNKLKEELDVLDNLHVNGMFDGEQMIKVYSIKRSDITKTQKFCLNSYFKILVKGLDKLYGDLISNIEDVLFLEGNIKNTKK